MQVNCLHWVSSCFLLWEGEERIPSTYVIVKTFYTTYVFPGYSAPLCHLELLITSYSWRSRRLECSQLSYSQTIRCNSLLKSRYIDMLHNRPTQSKHIAGKATTII